MGAVQDYAATIAAELKAIFYRLDSLHAEAEVNDGQMNLTEHAAVASDLNTIAAQAADMAGGPYGDPPEGAELQPVEATVTGAAAPPEVAGLVQAPQPPADSQPPA